MGVKNCVLFRLEDKGLGSDGVCQVGSFTHAIFLVQVFLEMCSST